MFFNNDGTRKTLALSNLLNVGNVRKLFMLNALCMRVFGTTLRTLSYGRRYVLSRFFTKQPLILTHSLTSKCNCKCKMCDLWRKIDTSSEMATREVFSILEQARKLNFVGYVAWGGEPLLRKDTMEILKHAHDLGLYTSFITNGTYLADYAAEIARNVDLTFVSLDHPSDFHDKLRGSQGCFRKAVTGISEVKRRGGRITVNCVLSKLNSDAVRNMSELARNMDVEIAFDPMEIFPDFNEEFALSFAERRRAFLEVLQLKKMGYRFLIPSSFWSTS
jgi:MoaA/NifB/PqqE/SkfB family radical SAM enzyme